MAALQSIACTSPLSHCPQRHPSHPGIILASPSKHVFSSLNGSLIRQQRRSGHASLVPKRRCSKTCTPVAMAAKPKIQFIQGTDELSIPDVKLTKSRDGTNGVAIFRFKEPSVFDSSGELGDITGFYMIDEEGVLQSVDVNANVLD